MLKIATLRTVCLESVELAGGLWYSSFHMVVEEGHWEMGCALGEEVAEEGGNMSVVSWGLYGAGDHSEMCFGLFLCFGSLLFLEEVRIGILARQRIY